MKWQPVTDTQPQTDAGVVMLADADGRPIGVMSGRDDDAWYIDDAYYDGDDVPCWYLVLPACPSR